MDVSKEKKSIIIKLTLLFVCLYCIFSVLLYIFGKIESPQWWYLFIMATIFYLGITSMRIHKSLNPKAEELDYIVPSLTLMIINFIAVYKLFREIGYPLTLLYYTMLLSLFHLHRYLLSKLLENQKKKM